MPHKENCMNKEELGINNDGDDFCLDCGGIIKDNEDQLIIQAKLLSEKKKPKSFEEIDKRLKEIRHREFFGIAYNKNSNKSIAYNEKSNKRKSFDEVFNERIIPIVNLYWNLQIKKIDPPSTAGYFYIYLEVSYLDFHNLKKFDKDIGKHGWYLMSIVKQTEGFALRCKT